MTSDSGFFHVPSSFKFVEEAFDTSVADSGVDWLLSVVVDVSEDEGESARVSLPATMPVREP